MLNAHQPPYPTLPKHGKHIAFGKILHARHHFMQLHHLLEEIGAPMCIVDPIEPENNWDSKQEMPLQGLLI